MRRYKWESCDCPNCDKNMWRHGFIPRYFEGNLTLILLKRYRYPDCKNGEIQWVESRVNLAELAKLRYLQGWSRQRLASHYGRTLYAITNYCQDIKKKGFNLEGPTAEEKEGIRWAYQN
jgi:hypothetical protein